MTNIKIPVVATCSLTDMFTSIDHINYILTLVPGEEMQSRAEMTTLIFNVPDNGGEYVTITHQGTPNIQDAAVCTRDVLLRDMQYAYDFTLDKEHACNSFMSVDNKLTFNVHRIESATDRPEDEAKLLLSLLKEGDEFIYSIKLTNKVYLYISKSHFKQVIYSISRSTNHA